VDYDYSPTALKKVVYAGTQATSFSQGSRDLKELAELDVSPERVRRASERIGKERVAERDVQAAAYEALPIPARRIASTDQPVPAVACVQMDGGRLQYFDRAEPQRNEDDTFWREMKVGCVWRRHFADYVPILDFIHALTYVYAAAMAGQTQKEGWQTYRAWAQWAWSGQINRVLAALELRQRELGEPVKETPQTAPSAIVTKSLGYLRNQRSRMEYPEYRKQGLPITSTYVESTVKQINRRMKGTEKFWSGGVEAMLTLVADHLSDTPTLARFWRNRPHRLTGCRGYQSHAA
jgi:hypothetical protein